jgi:hypothetical protein
VSEALVESSEVLALAEAGTKRPLWSCTGAQSPVVLEDLVRVKNLLEAWRAGAETKDWGIKLRVEKARDLPECLWAGYALAAASDARRCAFSKPPSIAKRVRPRNQHDNESPSISACKSALFGKERDVVVV